MPELRQELAENLERVQRRIRAACQRAGRPESSVTLVCVSKTKPAEMVRAAYEAGARDFGENYGQELRDKAEALADLPGLRWHFIGGLQRNKVKYAAGRAALIHSVDKPELVGEIERRAAQAGRVQEVLVQANLAQEATKSGVHDEQQLRDLLAALAPCAHTRCVGLMTMPPFFDDPHRARPLFARLARLRERLGAEALPNVHLGHLSMGMSGDFEVAIEEGATLVRVGTAIFGGRIS